MLDRELPQSKQPGLVLEPGPAGTWDESAIGNPVVSAPSLCICCFVVASGWSGAYP